MRTALIEEALLEQYSRLYGVKEYNFLAITRQGMRSAVEILATAAMHQGKHVMVQANLGLRSITANLISIRWADVSDIPSGPPPMQPAALFATHESMFRVAPEFTATRNELGFVELVVAAQKDGLIMVCTKKSPHDIDFPLDFEGTVATADAESIYLDIVGTSPPAYGIASLGLFAKAVPDIDYEIIKQAAWDFCGQFPPKTREANIQALEKVYQETRIQENVEIKGKISREEYVLKAQQASGFHTGKLGLASSDIASGNIAYAWRTLLPVCDQRKCKCIECLVAYYCPEGAISWEDEVYVVDYEHCKGCGTCERECPEEAITMKPAEEVLASLASK